jgi:hypothetical protein
MFPSSATILNRQSTSKRGVINRNICYGTRLMSQILAYETDTGRMTTARTLLFRPSDAEQHVTAPTDVQFLKISLSLNR